MSNSFCVTPKLWSEWLAKELKKMDPQNPSYRMLYRKCRMADHSGLVRKLRNCAMFLLLFTMLLIAFELLLMPRLFPHVDVEFTGMKLVVFLSAMGLIAAAEIVLRIDEKKL